jgi:hypothetical protein
MSWPLYLDFITLIILGKFNSSTSCSNLCSHTCSLRSSLRIWNQSYLETTINKVFYSFQCLVLLKSDENIHFGTNHIKHFEFFNEFQNQWYYCQRYLNSYTELMKAGDKTLHSDIHNFLILYWTRNISQSNERNLLLYLFIKRVINYIQLFCMSFFFPRLTPYAGEIIKNFHVDFDLIDEILITNSAIRY